MNLVTRQALGCLIAFSIGGITRLLKVPSPAPLTLYGCLLVLMMTLGYIALGQIVK